MRWCASRCWSPTDHRDELGLRCWKRSATSPRSNSSPAARQPRSGPRTRATSPARTRHPGPVGRPPPARGLRLVHRRTGQSAHRVSVGRRPRRPRRRRRHRDIREVPRQSAENYEPIAWAEELIEPAHAVDHPRLVALYVMASKCYTSDGSRRLSATATPAQTVLGRRPRCELPYGGEGALGGPYLATGQPERVGRGCRAQLRAPPRHSCPHPDTPGYGADDRRCREQAMAAAEDLIEPRKPPATRTCSVSPSPTGGPSATPIPTDA